MILTPEQRKEVLALVGTNPNLPTGAMSFDKAVKVGEEIKSMSERRDLALYEEAKQKKLYPWEVLEERDPSPRNFDGEIISPLDAMERCLYTLGVNMKITTVDQFYAGPAMILAPAMILRWVKQGMDMAFGAAGVYSINRKVTGMNINPLFLEAESAAADAAKAPATTTDGKRLGATAGGDLPRTHVGYRDKDVKIGTYGRDLTFDYKVVKYATLQEMKLIFNFIGMQIAYDDYDNIYYIIENGDGSSGAPPSRLQITGSTAGGTLVFSDLITAIVRMQEGGFRISHWIGQSDSIIDMLALAQFSGANFRDQTLKALFTGRGPIETPLGNLVIAPTLGTADYLAFFDGDYAIAKGEEAPITIETDKIIRQQFEEAAIVGSWAFWKFAHDASGFINYS